MSRKQRAEFEALMARPCWTPEEVARWRTWVERQATGRTMWDYLGWWRYEAGRRIGPDPAQLLPQPI